MAAFEVGEVTGGEAGLIRIVRRKAVVAERHRSGRVTVRRADGSTIELEIDEKTAIEGRAVAVKSGAWGELRDDPAAAGFAADVVPAFDVVEIQRIGASAGARLGFTGEVVDQDIADDGGLRDAPSATPVMRATLVATGDAIAKHLAAPPVAAAAGTVGWVRAGTAATGMVMALVLVFAITDLTLAQAGIVALACAGVLVTLRPGPDLDSSWTRGAAFSRDATTAWLLFATAILVGIVALTAVKDGRAIWPLAMAVALVLYAAADALLDRTRRLVLRLARTPPAGTERVEGTVVGDRTARARRRSSAGYRFTSVSDVVDVGALVLVTDEGATVTVQPEEIVWCTTDISRQYDSQGTTSTMEETHTIAPHAEIVVWGRLVEEGGHVALRAVGTQPAIVLATAPGGRPLALARATLARRRLDLAVLALAIAAEVALALVLH